MAFNVLSLFDGMSCGQIALNRIGIQYDNYYASEIDKFAIKVTQKNYPKTIQLGDVTKIDTTKLPKIDLLMAGSPCQGFSFAGNQLNFNDPRSKLFFEFLRILDETKPAFFLLENVKMKKECEKEISRLLGVEPLRINSLHVVPQNRPRLYWTNLEVLSHTYAKYAYQKAIYYPMLVDIVDLRIKFHRSFYAENYSSSKPIFWGSNHFRCLRANGGGRTRGIGIHNSTGDWRKLTPIECEKLQTVPEDYTKDVSDTQRYKMLGNGWTVDIIAMILEDLKIKGVPFV